MPAVSAANVLEYHMLKHRMHAAAQAAAAAALQIIWQPHLNCSHVSELQIGGSSNSSKSHHPCPAAAAHVQHSCCMWSQVVIDLNSAPGQRTQPNLRLSRDAKE
jgi:hypothetical protein